MLTSETVSVLCCIDNALLFFRHQWTRRHYVQTTYIHTYITRLLLRFALMEGVQGVLHPWQSELWKIVSINTVTHVLE